MYPYLNHYTTNTKHNKRSNFDDIAPDVIKTLQQQWADSMPIVDLPYRCDVVEQTKAYALFAINNNDDETLVRFGVCLKSRYAQKVWAWVDGTTQPPKNYAPFLVVHLTANIKIQDLPYLPLFADFEQCLAWAWIDKNKIIN